MPKIFDLDFSFSYFFFKDMLKYLTYKRKHQYLRYFYVVKPKYRRSTMLNGRVMCLQILLVLFVVSAACGQNTEVLKAELKGMEGRLDAKIDGARDTLDAKIDGAKDALDGKISGTKNELTASINGVNSTVVTIKWIIGGIGVVFTIFLGFLGYLLNYFVKQLLPNMLQLESRSTGKPQQEPTSAERLANNTQSDDLVTERGS